MTIFVSMKIGSVISGGELLAERVRIRDVFYLELAELEGRAHAVRSLNLLVGTVDKLAHHVGNPSASRRSHGSQLPPVFWVQSNFQPFSHHMSLSSQSCTAQLYDYHRLPVAFLRHKIEPSTYRRGAWNWAVLDRQVIAAGDVLRRSLRPQYPRPGGSLP